MAAISLREGDVTAEMMKEEIRECANRRERECLAESEAYRQRLKFLRPLNWVTVVLPALVSTAAGAALIRDSTNTTLTFTAGVFTIVASLLIVVHKALKCDEYQAEADRVSRTYSALATRYRTIHECNPADGEVRLFKLEEEIAILRGSTTAALPERYRNKARPAGTPRPVDRTQTT